MGPALVQIFFEMSSKELYIVEPNPLNMGILGSITNDIRLLTFSHIGMRRSRFCQNFGRR